MMFAGHWHKDSFTNGDVIQILSTLEELHPSDRRNRFYSIVTSRCPTSMTKYKLYNKALSVKITPSQPRQSRRQQIRSNAKNSVSGTDIVLVMDKNCMSFLFIYLLCMFAIIFPRLLPFSTCCFSQMIIEHIWQNHSKFRINGHLRRCKKKYLVRTRPQIQL